jgi:hypothetical protein
MRSNLAGRFAVIEGDEINEDDLTVIADLDIPVVYRDRTEGYRERLSRRADRAYVARVFDSLLVDDAISGAFVAMDTFRQQLVKEHQAAEPRAARVHKTLLALECRCEPAARVCRAHWTSCPLPRNASDCPIDNSAAH